MTRRVHAGLVWSVWLLVVGSWLVAGPLGGQASDGIAPMASYGVFVVAFATVGALIAARRPRHPIGWILLGSVLFYLAGGLADDYAQLHLTNNGVPESAAVAAAWFSTWVWTAAFGPAATFGLLLFPTGRLPSRRWRGLAWFAAAGIAIMIVGTAILPGRLADHPVDNPIGLAAAPAVAAALAGAGTIALVAGLVGAIASLLVRYRRARNVERAQLTWLSYAAAIVGIALAALIVSEIMVTTPPDDLMNTIITLAMSTVPVAMGIAILRHRVFDIDVVINRTLVYGGLTLMLGAAYLGSVLLLQLALSPLTQGSGLAVAASTLAAAALFRPMRSRIQAVVDRRFYRRRYDAARTIEAFGAHLRHELDLDSLADDLQSVVRETMQPNHVSLWLRRSVP